jgi:error-prone DNA polymerase
MSAYVELQVMSNFSFLEGASHPEELVLQAAALGHPAVAITDRNSLAGIVRAHVAAKSAGIRPIIGARLDLEDGAGLLAWPTDRAGYGRLARLISLGRRRAVKGACRLFRADVEAHAEGLVLALLPPQGRPDAAFAEDLGGWARARPGDVYLAASHRLKGDDEDRIARLARLAQATAVPLVATNDALMHAAYRRPLADVLACIRLKRTIDTLGYDALVNGERHLKPAAAMAALFRDHPDAIHRTTEIADRCRFSLDELRYEYPVEITAAGRTPQEELVHLAWEGAAVRYPRGVPEKVAAQLRHELALIAELDFAPYFLTVHDIVRFARDRGILCQGRGSAANSAVCFCLHITAVDPEKSDLLFERFISAARGEPPDIDVDFEHERREEVIQYIYEKYGRERAGLAATVIRYRARSAIREVGKAMGFADDTVAALATQIWGWSEESVAAGEVRAIGLDPGDPRLARCLALARTIIGFPRHLSQHVGGFVITRDRLDEVVPIENAAMEDRTVICWDKDDLDALGILKIDILSLGMLTCVRKAFDLLRAHYRLDLDPATLPAEDPAVYDMLCEADSLGVFQVESRAQMAFLPRMRPRSFYDLVIEVAIVRPGPIQGDMVHPYLRRRNGEEPVAYASPELEAVLGKTLGVPLFQEQAMKIAVVAAGFTPAEADRLRRAMATFRHAGKIHGFREKFIAGMLARGYDGDFADRCFRQIEGFADYGFPESHAASFALLVYVSAWIKCHYPAVFACALLNSQPMGFYAPAQIVRDARAHGVVVRPPCVNASAWDCTLEPGPSGWALRLGLRQIKGLAEDDADWLVAARANGYADVQAVWRRAGLGTPVLVTLARADAFASLGLDRRQALWQIKAISGAPLALFAAAGEDEGADKKVVLPAMSLGEEVVEDYTALRLTLRAHPLALLRASLAGITPAVRLGDGKPGRRLTVAGLVLVRQRPGSAKGVVFITLEDETGTANIIVWPDVYERFRRVVLTARLLMVRGRLQRQGIVVHLVAERLEDASGRLDALAADRPLQPAVARADELKRGGPGGSRRRSPVPRPRHPREQAKVLFPSRDFH